MYSKLFHENILFILKPKINNNYTVFSHQFEVQPTICIFHLVNRILKINPLRL